VNPVPRGRGHTLDGGSEKRQFKVNARCNELLDEYSVRAGLANRSEALRALIEQAPDPARAATTPAPSDGTYGLYVLSRNNRPMLARIQTQTGLRDASATVRWLIESSRA